jgi:hypothetical protein
MNTYNKTLLTGDEFQSIVPLLKVAFREFTPRSQFINGDKKLQQHNHQALDATEQPNILSYPTIRSPRPIENIASFDDVFVDSSVYDLIKEKFRWIDNYVAENTLSVKNSFITFSTDITGAKIGVKHLHSLLNGDSCRVWSFAVPLYIADVDECAGFWYNSQDSLFPPRYYVDYSRIKQLDIQYNSIKLPKDGKIMSLMFDGARNPHYIDYTQHLYAFMVFDGVETVEQIKLGKRWITELL